ncbi:MAG: cadmium-translocating P-type ATPase [Rhodospirillaceae bacterium]|nr:cadmium-translocating P-type ATPase [Rhodospirillaceae bacterium]
MSDLAAQGPLSHLGDQRHAGSDRNSADLGLVDFVTRTPDGTFGLHLLVEGVHCGGCVRRIEQALHDDPLVVDARVNLSTRRLTLHWRESAEHAATLAQTIGMLGYTVVPYDPDAAIDLHEARGRDLLRAMAVAGFAAANVMMLSVAVWWGHAQDMDFSTRSLMHWVSALIALPAVAYAGRPFFRSALAALAARRVNMDVPISLAVLLAAGMSLVQTIDGARDAYFDSSVTLLFFLLLGRYLDHRARGKVRQAAERLLALGREPAQMITPDGRRHTIAASRIRPDMMLFVAAGARLPADGRVEAGRSDLDTSLLTGETAPVVVGPGDAVLAGALNTSAPLTVRATATGDNTVLAEIVRLVEAAEQKRSRYVALADRLAGIYAPAVHGLAAGAFLGWIILGGVAWQPALLIAVAVLIVTCPCALGLAVPAVQVVASGRLMQAGVLLKNATALERLAVVDTVVFDKTGTLTEGRPELINGDAIQTDDLVLAASLAAASRHPLAVALVRGAGGKVGLREGVTEMPGRGLECGLIRLGSRAWCGIETDDDEVALEMWLRREDGVTVRFAFSDRVRPDAAAVLQELQALGLRVEILSGDRPSATGAVADSLGIQAWRAGQKPADKCSRLEQLASQGHRVLFVGDGLNDAPALAAAHVSLSPGSAADISQNAADAVFQGGLLAPVVLALKTARRARRLVRQNFGLSLAYNVVMVPLAIAGFVTPLLAALAMSGSSLTVVCNALRLAWRKT